MDYSDMIDVGDYRLHMQSFGTGQPTVVFECGGGDNAESLANLAHEVQRFTRAVIYDRAGLGRSDPAPRPRSIQNAIADLHTLLQMAQISSPYLLVGHSFGGLIVRLYAHQHPHDVVGLVLLDVPPPDQALRELQLLPAPTPDEPPALTAMRDMAHAEWNDPLSNDEGVDKQASAAQLQATGRLGALPLVVMTAGIDEWEKGFPTEIAHELEADWMRMQQELAELSTNSTHIIATESTHAIQDCQPDLVISVIREMVESLRQLYHFKGYSSHTVLMTTQHTPALDTLRLPTTVADACEHVGVLTVHEPVSETPTNSNNNILTNDKSHDTV